MTGTHPAAALLGLTLATAGANAADTCGPTAIPGAETLNRRFAVEQFTPGPNPAVAEAFQAVAALAADFPAEVTVPLAWGKQVVMDQRHNGLPVLGGRVAVTYNGSNEPIAIQGQRLKVSDTVPIEPAITEAQAVAIVASWLQANATPPGQVFTPLRPASKELAIHVDAEGASHLVYRIVQPTWDVAGMGGTYQALVDAISGVLLDSPRDINRYDTPPQGPLGRVYRSGNPVAGLRRPKLKDSDPIPDRAYRTVTLEHLLNPAELVGSYVDTVSLTAEAYRAVPVDGHFRFRRNPSDPADGAHFDAVMAYYTIDQAQQFLQNSGADAALQRSIRVNVNGSDGSHPYYVPGDDFIMLSSGGVDAGEDAETILHEYFHAVQEWLKPGAWGGASNPGVCAGTQALAEGYSDFFAALLTAQKPPYRYLIGEWSATTSDLPKRDLRTRFPYPQQTGADEYRNGSLWAGALLEVEQLNGYAMNPVWLDAMSLTEPGFSFSDAASAVLTAADQRHLPSKYQPALLRALTSRGFIGSDLAVRLTLPDQPVKVGQEFSYPVTVTVANHGPEAAAAVTLTGAIGKPAELVSAPANCRADGNAFSCDLTGLAVGSETSVQLTVSGTKLGKARITANAALKSYGNSWVATQHLGLLDPTPLNNRSRVGLPIVDWCADISGSWNYGTSFRLYCTIPEGVVVNQPINDSGLIDIAQNGCRFHWNAGGGMKRRGRMHRNRFSFGGILVKSVASNASIQFYNNHVSVHGTYTGDRIDHLKAQATVNGRGCLGSQCRDFTCSTPGGISMSFTRAD